MSTDDQLEHALRRWVKVFMRRSMREFLQSIKRSGLSMSQQGTLMRLHFHGDCPLSEIAAHLGITLAAVSQMVDRMVQQGLLERTEDSRDRRVKRISLTEAGRAQVDQALEARLRWMQDLATKLSQDDQATIAQALECLTEAALELEEPASVLEDVG